MTLLQVRGDKRSNESMRSLEYLVTLFGQIACLY